MKQPYIWNDKIKIKTKDGKYDYEEETKVKVKKIENNRFTKQNS